MITGKTAVSLSSNDASCFAQKILQNHVHYAMLQTTLTCNQLKHQPLQVHFTLKTEKYAEKKYIYRGN